MIKINDVLIGGQFCQPTDIIYTFDNENKSVDNIESLELKFKKPIVIWFDENNYYDLILITMSDNKLHFKIEDRKTQFNTVQSETMLSLQNKIIDNPSVKEVSIYNALHAIMCIIGDTIESEELLNLDVCNCELVLKK